MITNNFHDHPRGQVDNLYQMGFSRLNGSVPYPSFGAYSGYSVALNTGYAAAALYGNAYRDLPITSYACQINTTTGTAPGQHTLTTLTSGVQTSASATIANTGMSTMHVTAINDGVYPTSSNDNQDI